jgi:hypothetical protein
LHFEGSHTVVTRSRRLTATRLTNHASFINPLAMDALRTVVRQKSAALTFAALIAFKMTRVGAARHVDFISLMCRFYISLERPSRAPMSLPMLVLTRSSPREAILRVSGSNPTGIGEALDFVAIAGC